MLEELRLALFAQARKGVDTVITASQGRQEPHRVWRRNQDSSWHGTHEMRPSYMSGFAALNIHLEQMADAITPLWTTSYPYFANGPVFIMTGLGGWSASLSTILRGIVASVITHSRGQRPSDDAIRAAIDQLGDELASLSVRTRFVAPAIGFQVTDPAVDRVPLNETLALIRLNDDDFQDLHGGSVFDLNEPVPLADFAFCGEFDLAISINVMQELKTPVNPQESVEAALRSAARALAVFKSGHIEYQRIHFRALRPSVLYPGSLQTSPYHRGRRGSYVIESEDFGALAEHIKRMNERLFPALNLACRRLVDAESRHSSVDAISDAVIGLEALLAGDGEREGLRFKFALNYASIAEHNAAEQRRLRYREASDLYLIRSKVFHGADGGAEQYRLGDAKFSLADIASRSREMLRETIKTFLALAGVPDKKSEEFWKDYWVGRYFGAPATPTGSVP